MDLKQIADYVTTYLDPAGTLRPDDDAVVIVTLLDRLFSEEGGAGITVPQMRDYLDSLKGKAA